MLFSFLVIALSIGLLMANLVKLFQFNPHMVARLMLAAPVIREVAHGQCISRFNFQESSIHKHCHFQMHVKSWHSLFSYAWRLRRCVQTETRRNIVKCHKHTFTPTGRENFLLMLSVLSEIVISAAKKVLLIVEVKLRGPSRSISILAFELYNKSNW